MSFSSPYLYNGVVFAGRPNFVACAEQKDTLNGDCLDLSVCVMGGTLTEELVRTLLPGSAILAEDNPHDVFRHFVLGTCKVIFGNPLSLDEKLSIFHFT